MLPDTYSVPVTNVQRVNTNPRYAHFTQTHFTAGDEDQFLSHVRFSAASPPTPSQTPPSIVSPIYRISNSTNVDTFRYLFYKFKKGLLVQIRNGRVATFLPFSNAHFRNEWWRGTTPVASLPDQCLPVDQWYTNNGLMRYESPCNETDTGMCHLKHMFETVCARRSVPDVDVFVNKRDFPLLREDRTEPYDSIWGDYVELQSHSYDHYTPLLGMTTADGYLDLPIPTCEDWNRVMLKEGVHFAQTKHVLPQEYPFPSNWRAKKDQVVFRGSSTGLGTCTQTNPRLKVVHLYAKHPLFDVGITKNNDRLRKMKGSCFLQVPRQVPTVPGLSLLEQSEYKYVLHLPGHSQAYRLVVELAMHVVILMVECRYRIWIEAYMQPWEHYVPVAADLSDLETRVQWCIDHPDECQAIVQNARALYDTRCATSEMLLDQLLETLKQAATAIDTTVDLPVPAIEDKPAHVATRAPSTRYWKDMAHHPLNANPKHLRFFKKMQIHATATLVSRNTDQLQCVQRPWNESVYALCRRVINPLLKYVPNFVYTFHRAGAPEGSYLQESVRGYSLGDWIKSSHFTLEGYTEILVQCFCALAVAQNRGLLTLTNCTAWNVRVTQPSSSLVVDYSVDVGTVVRVAQPQWVPVFTSFDSAVGFARTKMGSTYRQFDPVMDVKSLVGSCLKVLFGARLPVNSSLVRLVFGTDSPSLTQGYYHIAGGSTPHYLVKEMIDKIQSKTVFRADRWTHHHTGIQLQSSPLFSESSNPLLNSYKYKLLNAPYTAGTTTAVTISLPVLHDGPGTITPAYLPFLASVLDILNSDIPSEETRADLLRQYQRLTGAQGVEGPWRRHLLHRKK